MGRFVKDDRARLLLQLFQNGPKFLFIVKGKKAFKAESPGGESRQGQCCDTGRRSRQRSHCDSCLLTHFDQHLSGIGDRGRSRIRDQGDVLSLLKEADELMPLFHPVIFMIAGHGRMYIKMIQKPDAVSGILRRDQIHTLQSFRHSRRHVPQISDRRGTQIKRSRHFSSLSLHKRHARRSPHDGFPGSAPVSSHGQFSSSGSRPPSVYRLAAFQRIHSS